MYNVGTSEGLLDVHKAHLQPISLIHRPTNGETEIHKDNISWGKIFEKFKREGTIRKEEIRRREKENVSFKELPVLSATL